LETAKLIRKIAPTKTIVAGSLSLSPHDYLREMFDYGIFDYADAISFHPYWLDADGSVAQIAAVRQLARERGFTGELWVTEVGYPTGGLYPTSTDLNGQADRVVKVLTGAAVQGSARGVLVCDAGLPTQGQLRRTLELRTLLRARV
ncbi:MAG: hypothetical protein HC888_18090, partial [Candidatus Competibacteraceae bacterium]|nr:hypothetical protein [Candidatus Competibacteraceae bacterium]